jgi:predicted O-methyltransferase YrrM
MDRRITHEEIDAYLVDAAPERPDVVHEMEREAAERHFPIVGPAVGSLLEVLARGIGARRVFEMGSGFGYSTFWFARAVGPGGRVVHTDGSADESARAKDNLARIDYDDRVRFEVGDAVDLLDREDGPFDIVFCDVDKHDYPRVPELAVPRLREGGLLIFDNMLWYGRVVDEAARDDATTRGVQEVTRLLREHSELTTTILPLRDGVSVSVRGASRPVHP